MPYTGPRTCDHCGKEVNEKAVIWNIKTQKVYCADNNECRKASIK